VNFRLKLRKRKRGSKGDCLFWLPRRIYNPPPTRKKYQRVSEWRFSEQTTDPSLHTVLGIDFNCANIVRILRPCTLPVRSTTTGLERRRGGGWCLHPSLCERYAWELLKLPRAKT